MMSRRLLVGLIVGCAGSLALAAWYVESSRSTAIAGTQEPAEQPRTGANQRRQNQARQPAQSTPATPQMLEGAAVLSSGDSYDDFCSIAQASDGTLYAAYAAYFDAHDQIRIHKRLPNGQWSTRTYAPLAEARPDIWMPQLAVDAKDRLWVIWCEQTDRTRTESGNWDLYARSLVDETWGPLVRLTDDPKPDINPHVCVDKQRNIHVVWQAHPENYGNIQYCRFNGEEWSRPLAVTTGTTSDWYPQVAVDGNGVAWIAFDSYRNGDYDVFLTSVKDGRVGELLPVATSGYYEAHATVACTPDQRVWVAWEEGGFNWGKDQGYWLRREEREQGSTLGSRRVVRMAVRGDGQWWSGPALAPDVSGNGLDTIASPVLAAGGDGRVWLRYRQLSRGQAMGGARRVTRYWTENVTYLDGAQFAAPKLIPASNGRISVFSRLMPAADGSTWIAYSSDQRAAANFHQPIHDRALVYQLPAPTSAVVAPELTAYQPPQPPPGIKRWDVARENAEIRTARSHRITVGDEKLLIVRGDLHRHTELSWDVGPGNDGSYLDFYRYMIDAAAMDFGGLTDHQGGGHYAYHWWLTEKSSDMYYLAPRFVPLYGYERSARFPNGHRNVFHTYRGVPVFPFQLRLGQSGVFPGVGTGELVENDTKLLYEYLRKTKGLAISHTSGTSTMGTDWRDNDPWVEPVVEIYQGARNSYEVVGGPRVHDVSKEAPNAAPGGYQEAGMVWNALAKGYRLGTTASSDHGSTHISYSMVYTPANNRETIVDAVRKRHTYGSTGNVVMEVWANGRFMGDELETRDRPQLTLKVIGTAPLARVDLVRSGQYIYTAVADQKETEIKFVDMEPLDGLNYYYFRIVQEDGEVAWSSPVWIRYDKGS